MWDKTPLQSTMEFNRFEYNNMKMSKFCIKAKKKKKLQDKKTHNVE